MKVRVYTLLQGIVMGIAEIIPGVSGSTLALVMGIYDNFIEFLSEVSDFFKDLLKFILRKESFKSVKDSFFKISWNFGIFLVAGMGISIVLFSHIISDLIERHPQYIFSFFFGLVIASISIPWNEMKLKGVREFAIIALTFIVFFVVLGLKPAIVDNPSPLFLFLAGAVAICAMVLPGISGSFVMLLLGVYDHVIGLIKDFTRLSIDLNKVIALLSVVAGIILGFSVFVKFLKLGLKKYPSEIMAFLIGIMLASLRVLWPFMDVSSLGSENSDALPKVLPWEIPGTQLLLSVIFIIIAIAGVVVLHKISGGNNTDDIE